MVNQILETIKQATRETKILRVIYTEKDGTSEGWRHIEPYSFSHDDGEQALFAWDINKNGIRRFVIDRISQIEITDQFYTPRYKIEISWI